MIKKTTNVEDRERIIKLYLKGMSVLNNSKVMAQNRMTVYQIITKYQIT